MQAVFVAREPKSVLFSGLHMIAELIAQVERAGVTARRRGKGVARSGDTATAC
ncbi:MAG: hypothetical protein GY943_11350 [Chloroflexi bacterium]|nr:hypothetical protein [Chloroflexota bacterium]